MWLAGITSKMLQGPSGTFVLNYLGLTVRSYYGNWKRAKYLHGTQPWTGECNATECKGERWLLRMLLFLAQNTTSSKENEEMRQSWQTTPSVTSWARRQWCPATLTDNFLLCNSSTIPLKIRGGAGTGLELLDGWLAAAAWRPVLLVYMNEGGLLSTAASLWVFIGINWS